MSYFNLAAHALRHAEVYPEKPALIFIQPKDATLESFEQTVFTYIRLKSRVYEIATYLHSLGFAKGERILLQFPHSPDFGFAYLASILSGLVPVALSPTLTKAELTFIVEDCRPRAVVSSESQPLEKVAGLEYIFIERLGQFEYKELDWQVEVPTHKNDPAFLIYTSGTTGTPKGVVHAQRSLLGREPMYKGWLGITHKDRLLHAGEFNWTYTLGVGLCDPLAVGATSILYHGPRNDMTLWPKLVLNVKATLFAAVPSLYRRILKYNSYEQLKALGSLRHGLTAGEPLSPELYQQWHKSTGLEMYEALGMSEISTYISSGPSVKVIPGVSGKIQAGRKVTILSLNDAEKNKATSVHGEVGMLAVHKSDPGLMLGYYKSSGPELPLIGDEWFCGGDLGLIDGEGYFHFHGRNDDVMNTFGYRVSPLEVEAALNGVLDVAELAVTDIELKDKPGVRIIAAFVVLHDDLDSNHQNKIKEALASKANETLASYKQPGAYFFVEELPRSKRGKLQRQKLKLLT